MSLGALYVVSGPSGAGKSTVCKLVRERLGINLSISATSRKPRNGEQEGVDYFFITAEDFERKIKNGDFLEYANVHGNYYGTLKSEVEERLKRGEKVFTQACAKLLKRGINTIRLRTYLGWLYHKYGQLESL